VHSKNNKSVVVIWSDGFPFKLTAFNEKNSLLAKALILAGYRVILTSKSSPPCNSNAYFGIFEKIQWRFFIQNQIQSRLVRSMVAVFSEMKFLLTLKKNFNKVYLVGSYYPFTVFLFYSLFCLIFNIRLVLNIMEWHIGVYRNSSIQKRINAFLFDKYAVKLSKGTIAISEFIISNLKHYSHNYKFIFIPALTDIEKIDAIQGTNQFSFPYVLYCGGLGYAEVIATIIDGFEEYYKRYGNMNIHLVLILHGKNEQFRALMDIILQTLSSKNVHLLNNLPFRDLIRHYKNASALLIPMRDTLQDKARYPQKIAEYAACKRPIISNAVGQIGFDFKHKSDIYFMPSYTSADLAKAIKEVIEDKKIAFTITENARLKAETYFDYKLYSLPLHNFLKNL